MAIPIWGEFDWANGLGREDADAVTTGKLRLHVAGLPTWGSSSGGVEWIWRELLAGLAQSWDRLLFEGWIEGRGEGGGRPGAREDLVGRAHARVGYGDASIEWLESLDEAAFEWEQAHELSRFLPGVVLPEVFIFAVDGGVEFATVHASMVVSTADADAALSALGDQIALQLAGSGDIMARELVDSWHRRRGPATDSLASALVGVPQDALRHARGTMAEAQAWGSADGTMGWTPYLAIAKACRQVGRHTMGIAMATVTGLPDDAVWSSAAASLSEFVWLTRAWMPESAEPLIGSELRGLAGVEATEAVSLLRVAGVLGIVVVEAAFDEEGFPGLAVHSSDRAPLMLMNARCFGAADEASRRFAVAAGISTLLQAKWDDAIAAFLLETGEPDRRRHRIALEFLLPLASLEEAVLQDPTSGTLHRICARFGVGFGIVAQQVRASRVFGALGPADQEEVIEVTEGTARPIAHKIRAVLRSVA